MGAAILQLGCTIQCPHGGTASAVSGNTRVKVDGKYALLLTDTFTIAGCPFTLPGPKPSPCITVEWKGEAQKVKVTGKAVLLQTSTGLCKSAEQAVQGTVILSGVQTKVKGV